MFIVSMWQLVRDLHNVKRSLRPVEDLIHLFERPVSSFWEEKIHAWAHEGVDYGKDNVGLVPDIGEGDRCDHDDHELFETMSVLILRIGCLRAYVEDPICCC